MTKPYPDYQCLYRCYSLVAQRPGLKYSEIAGSKALCGMRLDWRIEQTVAALHELRDKGLIEGRNGYYSRYHQAPCEWHAVRPWPLCYCSWPRIATEAVKKRMRKHAYDAGVPWSEREKAEEFVPIDGEPEEDTGLVDRTPTSVGKGQRRLDA